MEVHVHALDLLEFGGSLARILVRCSAGTYVRSIAHEAGQRLACGAFLDALRRTGSGEFQQEQARTLEQLEQLAETEKLDEALIPASSLLPHLPSATVDPVTAGQIRARQGFSFRPPLLSGTAPST